MMTVIIVIFEPRALWRLEVVEVEVVLSPRLSSLSPSQTQGRADSTLHRWCRPGRAFFSLSSTFKRERYKLPSCTFYRVTALLLKYITYRILYNIQYKTYKTKTINILLYNFNDIWKIFSLLYHIAVIASMNKYLTIERTPSLVFVCWGFWTLERLVLAVRGEGGYVEIPIYRSIWTPATVIVGWWYLDKL